MPNISSNLVRVVTTIVTAILLVTAGIIYLAASSSSAAKAARKAAEAAAPAAAAKAATVSTVEALVLTFEGYTPCSAFVDWNYKIRSDGYPLRIKYQDSDWVEISGKGVETMSPATFRPGETLFESPDPQNSKVRVQVYTNVSVQAAR